MKYSCPICRVPLDRHVAMVAEFGWRKGTVCDECRPAFVRGYENECPPPFPWKRRALVIYRRARRTSRSLEERFTVAPDPAQD